MLLHRSCNKAMLHWQQPDRHGHAACACACFAVSIVLAFTLLSMHAVSLYMCATALDQRMGRSHAGLVLLYHMIYRHMNKPRAGIHINAALRHEAYRVAQRRTAEAHSRARHTRFCRRLHGPCMLWQAHIQVPNDKCIMCKATLYIQQ